MINLKDRGILDLGLKRCHKGTYFISKHDLLVKDKITVRNSYKIKSSIQREIGVANKEHLQAQYNSIPTMGVYNPTKKIYTKARESDSYWVIYPKHYKSAVWRRSYRNLILKIGLHIIEI